MTDERYEKLYKIIDESEYKYDCIKTSDEEKTVKEVIRKHFEEDNNVIIDKILEKLPYMNPDDLDTIITTEYTYVSNRMQYEDIMNLDDSDYLLWVGVTKGDGCHLHQNNMITRKGNRFPNNCLYPGDKNAPINEWLDCRCTLMAVILDDDEEAPDKEYWYPSEIIKK